jgi:hypothetical protein
MALYGFIWVYMAFIWVDMALYGLIWLYIRLYGLIWLFCLIWVYIALYGFIIGYNWPPKWLLNKIVLFLGLPHYIATLGYFWIVDSESWTTYVHPKAQQDVVCDFCFQYLKASFLP